jgi:hypothetical protein
MRARTKVKRVGYGRKISIPGIERDRGPICNAKLVHTCLEATGENEMTWNCSAVKKDFVEKLAG